MTEARQGNIAVYLKLFKRHNFIQIFVLKLLIYISLSNVISKFMMLPFKKRVKLVLYAYLLSIYKNHFNLFF